MNSFILRPRFRKLVIYLGIAISLLVTIQPAFPFDDTQVCPLLKIFSPIMDLRDNPDEVKESITNLLSVWSKGD
ncbi:MAG: hypothetical protein RJQ09_13475 [Cyclobacteriaceae bacterium]